jgi:hypothetical protein
MPGQQAIQAGKAFVEFVLSDKKVGGQIAAIGSKMRKMGGIGLAVSGPLTAAFAATALTFASVGSELADLHARSGRSVQDLSELKYAAKQSGTDLGTLEKAFRVLQAKGTDPAEFDTIAAEIGAIPDETERARAAMELFGKKTGASILPLLQDLPELRQKARDLGVTMSAENAAAADELGDALDTAGDQFQALVVQIGAAIAGPLTKFLVWSQQMLAGVIEFVRENPNMVAAIAATTAAIAAVSAAAVSFGVILTIISLHPIIAALTLIAGLVVGVAVYFGLASDAAGDFKESLDGVDMPGASPAAQARTQAATTNAQLQTALAGGEVRFPTGTSASADPAAKAAATRSYLPDIAKATRETADGIKQMVRLVNYTPLGILAQVLPG